MGLSLERENELRTKILMVMRWNILRAAGEPYTVHPVRIASDLTRWLSKHGAITEEDVVRLPFVGSIEARDEEKNDSGP